MDDFDPLFHRECDTGRQEGQTTQEVPQKYINGHTRDLKPVKFKEHQHPDLIFQCGLMLFHWGQQPQLSSLSSAPVFFQTKATDALSSLWPAPGFGLGVAKLLLHHLQILVL